MAAERGIRAGDDFAGGGGVSVALQGGAGIHILRFLQSGSVDKTIFRGNRRLRGGLGRQTLEGGDLPNLRNIFGFAEAGDGFRGKPEKYNDEKV